MADQARAEGSAGRREESCGRPWRPRQVKRIGSAYRHEVEDNAPHLDLLCGVQMEGHLRFVSLSVHVFAAAVTAPAESAELGLLSTAEANSRADHLWPNAKPIWA